MVVVVSDGACFVRWSSWVAVTGEFPGHRTAKVVKTVKAKKRRVMVLVVMVDRSHNNHQHILGRLYVHENKEDNS